MKEGRNEEREDEGREGGRERARRKRGDDDGATRMRKVLREGHRGGDPN
jgi:hypothetical protein